MREPVWVQEAVVDAIHLRQLAEHGGAPGVRDANLLASALARPRQLFAYGGDETPLPALAAAYGYGLARNHPFVDGNKRTAFVVTLLFLRLNGHGLDATQEERYRTFLALADGSLGERELAAWLHAHLTRAT
ncbi:MAG TPA: type II toxin-antitoxin system death-on-curing family toxin [Luteimonas sp.]|nr:type II toxin-antitoxin system death-on-curing family toxin [Luteimonas sp.]